MISCPTQLRAVHDLRMQAWAAIAKSCLKSAVLSDVAVAASILQLAHQRHGQRGPSLDKRFLPSPATIRDIFGFISGNCLNYKKRKPAMAAKIPAGAAPVRRAAAPGAGVDVVEVEDGPEVGVGVDGEEDEGVVGVKEPSRPDEVTESEAVAVKVVGAGRSVGMSAVVPSVGSTGSETIMVPSSTELSEGIAPVGDGMPTGTVIRLGPPPTVVVGRKVSTSPAALVMVKACGAAETDRATASRPMRRNATPRWDSIVVVAVSTNLIAF
ncbi:uncharacterized protein B0I36DRAFT_325528 [Microdochium trichocladiopsis]|uniref:Uncharacterized protein n=1 Tax=Microdochium trichocladiopsis TaxID=1682393 RepID=A0A9P8Y4C3_9PEZI|nr:uncharacterized protein B0I36DRAFT_325528 [Microdochium trichocladiopsis]KAH7029327.1 hypothetical protein B0I36DRAFT_325528 [Microdochium trichocladiopsis]